MADGSKEKSLKKGLLGWATGALNKIQNALDETAPADAPPIAEAEAAPAPAPDGRAMPRAAKTGELPSGPAGRKSGSLQLPDYAKRGPVTSELAKPGRDGLNLGSSPLSGPAAPSGPLKVPDVTKSPEEEAAESKKRLALILAYMKDPESDPSFKNKPLMYKILTEERTYQQGQIVEMQAELGKMPPPASAMGLSEEEAAADPVYAGLEERRAELQKQLNTAQTRQTQMFMLMKKLTGVKGKTGGTGFIAPPGVSKD